MLSADRAPLLVEAGLTKHLLKLYAYRDPRRAARTIPGYDGPHALRTARMCGAVALRLGYTHERTRQFQMACLLHDLGRAGLDPQLFSAIWSWARRRGIPTRPAEWRAVYPKTVYGQETEAFVSRFGARLEADGILMDAWAVEQVEMRLGYARRLARRVRALRGTIRRLTGGWAPWMEQIMLYYYYPERLRDSSPWVRQLAEILVACEQFEAYSNRRRGRDYYVRRQESLQAALAYLDGLCADGVLSHAVVASLTELVGGGAFDAIIAQARGRPVSVRERAAIRQWTGGRRRWP